jgi:hypothetical protein
MGSNIAVERVFGRRREKRSGAASGLSQAMALLVARTRLAGHLPSTRFRRGLRHRRAFRGLLQRVHDSRARAGEAVTLPSDRRDQCPRLDPRAGKLTIPISTAVEALQSNEVYLPRSRLRLDPALPARQINAIR